jgi:hypothetical protein
LIVRVIGLISAGTLGPILIAGTVDLMEEFDVGFATLSEVRIWVI